MNKFHKYLFTVSFLVFIFLGGFITLVKKEVKVSSVENRILVSKPTVSKQKLVEGTLFSEFDLYFKDQFMYRSKWIEAASKLDLMLDKKKYLDVVKGKDGYLLSFNSFNYKLDLNKLKEDIKYSSEEMKSLNEHVNRNGGKFIFAGIPIQPYFNANKYLDYFESMESFYLLQDNLFFEALHNDKISALNMKDIFSNQQDNLYFKTDHHYNFRGAYLTYKEILNSLINEGVKIQQTYNLGDFGLEKINKPFLGSWNAKINWLFKNDDYIELPNPKFQMPKYKKIVNGEEDNRLYYYNEDDKTTGYGAYMNGDKAEIIISTDRKNLPKALIFGDSFTNAVEPLLALHFDETRILDLRYYKGKSLYKYIEDYKPDVVIFIIGNNTYTYRNGNCNFRTIN